MNRRLARLAALLALLAPIALAGAGCAGVTAADIAPHAATARDLANRNNAAIATHCVGMPELARQALIRDNIDHAAQLAALQESAGQGPGWISSVIAWALSFSRLAGIVVADPQADAPDEQAMDANDSNATEPETPAPDDDGDGGPDGLEDCCYRHSTADVAGLVRWLNEHATHGKKLYDLPAFVHDAERRKVVCSFCADDEGDALELDRLESLAAAQE